MASQGVKLDKSLMKIAGNALTKNIEKLGTVYGCSLWEVRVFGMHVD